MRALPATVLIGLLAIACGGASAPNLSTRGEDAGTSGSDASSEGDSRGVDSAVPDDAEMSDVTAGDGGCINPAVGQPCTASDTICPDGINPCCRAWVWACDPTTHRWAQSTNGLGCACVMTVPCGSTTCAQGQLCVVDHIAAGACFAPDDAGQCSNGMSRSGPCCSFTSTNYRCAAVPSGCGSTLTCDCVTSICTKGPSALGAVSASCQSVSGTELDCTIVLP